MGKPNFDAIRARIEEAKREIDFNESATDSATYRIIMEDLPTLIAEYCQLENFFGKYAESARVIVLHLSQFCDRRLPYPEMIADASRKAGAAIEHLRKERDAAVTDLFKCSVGAKNECEYCTKKNCMDCITSATNTPRGWIWRGLEKDMPDKIKDVIKALRHAEQRGFLGIEFSAGETADLIESLKTKIDRLIIERDEAVADSRIRRTVKLTPIYTCGGHGHQMDGDGLLSG